MWTIYKLWKTNEHTILKLWTLIKNIIERTHKFPYNILFTFLMDRGRAPNGIGHLMILLLLLLLSSLLLLSLYHHHHHHNHHHHHHYAWFRKGQKGVKTTAYTYHPLKSTLPGEWVRFLLPSNTYLLTVKSGLFLRVVQGASFVFRDPGFVVIHSQF